MVHICPTWRYEYSFAACFRASFRFGTPRPKISPALLLPGDISETFGVNAGQQTKAGNQFVHLEGFGNAPQKGNDPIELEPQTTCHIKNPHPKSYKYTLKPKALDPKPYSHFGSRHVVRPKALNPKQAL